MSQRVVGYEGEGRARRPIYTIEAPAVARANRYVANAARRGFAIIGGTLVEGGPGEYQQHRDQQRAFRDRRRGEG
jgi:hypothetical protein